jgi:polyisoprenoid-binding protein YceI
VLFFLVATGSTLTRRIFGQMTARPTVRARSRARRPRRGAGQPARYEIDPDHFSVAFSSTTSATRVIGLFQRRAARSLRRGHRYARTRLVVDAAAPSPTTTCAQPPAQRGLQPGSSQIVFKGAKAKRTGERTFVVEGQLELLGKTEPVSFDVTWNKSGPYEMPGDKAYVMGASARGSFKRSRFGMNYGVANGWVGDTVELMVEFEARRK